VIQNKVHCGAGRKETYEEKGDVKCCTFFCISLHTLYGAMTAFVSIFQPYAQSSFLLFEEGAKFLQKELPLSVP